MVGILSSMFWGRCFIALSVSILQSFLMMNRPIIQHLAMTSSQTKSKMTPSKPKATLSTQANYLPMSPKNAHNNDNLNTQLKEIFTAIEASANGYPSEHDIKGLFADFDTTSNRLGNTVADKKQTPNRRTKRRIRA